MTNNARITLHNDLIDEAILKANTLPDAGGVDLPELTNEGTSADILSGKQLISGNGEIVTGSMPIATQATPSISVNSSGLITASTTQTAGYVSAGTKSGTKQLTVQGAKTVTPSTSAQTAVASGVYTTGNITVAAMPTATQATPTITVNSSGLVTASATQTAGYVSAGTKSATKQLTTQAAKTITPSKSSQTAVAKDVYTTGAITVAAIPSQYITTTDATAEASEIFDGESAYVNGKKIIGNFTIADEMDTQGDLISQIQTALEGKTAAGTDTSDATATADEIFLDKIAYTAEGKVTGKFTIANEIATQTDLISNIQTTLSGKTAGSGGSSGGELATCNLTITVTMTDDTTPFYFTYSTVENGVVTSNYCKLNMTNNQINIPNALCNSIISMTTYNSLYNSDGMIDSKNWHLEHIFPLYESSPGSAAGTEAGNFGIYRIPQTASVATLNFYEWEW
jgi:hypothetical protein